MLVIVLLSGSANTLEQNVNYTTWHLQPRYFNSYSIFGQLGKPDEQVICTIEIVKILILLSVC